MGFDATWPAKSPVCIETLPTRLQIQCAQAQIAGPKHPFQAFIAGAFSRQLSQTPTGA